MRKSKKQVDLTVTGRTTTYGRDFSIGKETNSTKSVQTTLGCIPTPLFTFRSVGLLSAQNLNQEYLVVYMNMILDLEEMHRHLIRTLL